MKLSREIGVYQKEGEKLIDNFPINLSKSQLIEILNIDEEDDPNVYKVYSINESQYLVLSKMISELQKYDFEKVEIFYECYQK